MSRSQDQSLSEQERRLRSLLRFWTVLFGAGAVSFGVDPDRSTRSLNILPGAPLPPSSEKYWNALAVSLMATLTTMCGMAASDVRRRRALVVPVMVSKAVSSGMYLARYREERRTPYLVGAAVDGSILAITARAFVASRRRFRRRRDAGMAVVRGTAVDRRRMFGRARAQRAEATAAAGGI